MPAPDGPDAVAVGERLRVARNGTGLTQEQVAQKLNVARTTVVAIERGDRAVRPDELIALAELYGTSVHALVRKTAVHVDLTGQFRRAAGTTDEESAEAMKLLNRLAASSVELERRLRRPLVADYPPERALTRGRLDAQAEDLAAELRSRLGLGMAPIPDLVGLVELELGIRIFIRGLPSKIAGVFAFHPEVGACVVLNAKHPRKRRAWTLAHEIGHFLTKRHVPDVVLLPKAGKPATESFADYFAPALLMPSAVIRRAFADTVAAETRFSSRHLILLAQKFHVSVEALCRRLEQLDLLPQGTYEALRDRGLSAKTVRTVTGEDDELSAFAPPSRLTLLAADAFSAGLLSEGQVADMLAVDRIEAREILDALDADSEEAS